MKLYTEKKIIETFSTGVLSLYNGYIKERLETLTPIELPSDEHIYNILRGKKMFEKDWEFIEGAKWMKEQILNQNK